MAARRDRPGDRAGFIVLSAEPRAEPAPKWPLAHTTKFERDLWEHEWKRPQARMWEKLDLVMEVALYVRSVRIAQGPLATSSASDRKLVQSQADRLGLTVSGLRYNRWILEDPPELKQQVARPDDPDRIAAKARFLKIEGGAAG